MKRFVILFTLVLPCTLSAQTATISGLGSLDPLYTNSAALEISADGAVVAGKSGGAPFRWTDGGGMVLLNLPPNQISQITPTGISTDGNVIAGYDASGFNMSPIAHLWASNTGSFEELQPPAFELNGLSGDGAVAVGHLLNPNPPPFSVNVADQPVRWTQANGIQNLDKGFFATQVSATNISSDGSTIVGYYGDYYPGFFNGASTSACYWPDAFFPPSQLLTLDPLPGGTHAKANAASADGAVIVGYSDSGAQPNVPKAVRWVRVGFLNQYIVHELDSSISSIATEATAVSADGSRIVGTVGISTFSEARTAFVWDANNGQRPLQTALTSVGANPQADWSSLVAASGISADGHAIVGTGINMNAQTEAFRAWLPVVPPTPAVSTIADTTILPNTSAVLAFTLTDADTDPALLTVNAESSNPTLVPVVNIVFTSSGANRTATITPAAGEIGSTIITLIVSDGSSSSREEFVLNVFPPPETPVVTVLPASRVDTRSAWLNGTVNPKWAETLLSFILDGEIDGTQVIPAGGEPVQVTYLHRYALQPGSSHTFSISAQNIAGTASSPTSETFTLLGGPPSVTTLAPTRVTPTKAKLRATVNPNQVPTFVTFYVGGVAVGTVTVREGTEPVTVTFDYNAGVIPGQAISFTTSATNTSNQTGTGTNLDFNLMASDTTFGDSNNFLWAANAGWVNAKPATNYGFRTGDTVCSGFLWGANIGWIHAGNGEPTNGIRYTNTGSDYGVNVMPDGTLRGYAWGQNIGWVNFESTGAPAVDLTTGSLTGYAWGQNIGWINLSTATTTQLAILDTDNDGISDAWENEKANGNLATLGNPGDADGDGQSDRAEFTTDTDPLDGNDRFQITNFSQINNGGFVSLEFTSKNTRFYQVHDSPDLTGGSWQEVGDTIPGEASFTTANFGGPAATRKFYRVSAMRPLAGP